MNHTLGQANLRRVFGAHPAGVAAVAALIEGRQPESRLTAGGPELLSLKRAWARFAVGRLPGGGGEASPLPLLAECLSLGIPPSPAGPSPE